MNKKNQQEEVAKSIKELTGMDWWLPCEGCADGHPSFWKTCVQSPQWKAWEKEQARRLHIEVDRNADEFDNKLWDIDECREGGFISAGHFQDFMAFCARS